MIACKTKHQHWLNRWLARYRNNALSYATHGQDSRLRLIDNGVKDIYPVHTQVADGKSTTLDMLWTQFAGLGFRNQVLASLRKSLHTEFIRPLDYWYDQSLLRGYRQPDIDFVVPGNRTRLPGGV